MAFEITPQIQKLVNDATDFAVKSILIAVGTSDTAAVLAIGEAVKTSVDAAVANNTTDPDAIQTVEAGLKVVSDGLTIGGKTALAADVDEAEVLIGNLESGTGNPVFAGIKTFFEKIFAPKKYAAALAASGTKA